MGDRTPPPIPATLETVDQLKVKATPMNRGTASASEHLSSTDVNDVAKSIHIDIRKYNTCRIDVLLEAFLVRCWPKNKGNPPSGLLDDCIRAVLPICNTNTRLRDQLQKYTIASSEVSRYMPFAYSFNYALDALRNIENLGLRGPSQIDLLFHRNDPKLITATHRGYVSQRKPDVVLVSLETARRGLETGDSASWFEYALKTAGEKPKNKFRWGDILLNVEFKRTLKSMDGVPKEYNAKLAEDIPPQNAPLSFDADFSNDDSEAPKPDSPTPVLASRHSERLSSNQKRSQEQASSETKPNKKFKSDGSLPVKLPPMVQSGLYAAERLSHACWVSHAINLVIINDVAYIWWYDREGAIQSHGINFVKDLPRFLVLLLAFQRFSLEDWGIIPDFEVDFKQTRNNTSRPFSFPESSVDISISYGDVLHDHYGIVGRATQLLCATSESPHPGKAGCNLKDTKLVVKVYWPEESRVSEEEIIGEAVEIGEGNEHVKGHIPDLLCSHDYVEYSTANIRKALNLESHPRILRVMLFRRLYPITDLTGDLFWKAFWQCFRCHHHLWVGGIEHNDISLRNLMYDKHNDNRGILNDFDLAHLKGRMRPSGTERTGTIPFMALDLLSEEGGLGQVEHLYRHDCESFAWVLLWICCRYDNGKETEKTALNFLLTADHVTCFKEKHALLPAIHGMEGTQSYKEYKTVAAQLLRWSYSLRFRKEEGDEVEEFTTDEVVDKYKDILSKAGYRDVELR